MNLAVDFETIRVTTRCEKNHACLSKDSSSLCEVREFVDGYLHFVQCGSDKHCSYQEPFGSSCLCSCPTRKQIYNLYKF